MFKFILVAVLLAHVAHAATDVSPIYKETYSAYASSFSPPATPTDMCVISGSATKKIKIRRVEITGVQSVGGVNDYFLARRSTADTGGTASSMTVVPHDSGSNAATIASVALFTANPTLGAFAGNIRATKIIHAAAVASSSATGYVWDFDTYMESNPLVLNGVAQELAINFGGAALPSGLSIMCGFTWTEE